MKFTRSHNGNRYAKRGDLTAIIAPTPEDDAYRLTIKCDFNFDTEQAAMEAAEAVLRTLEAEGLTMMEPG